MRHCIQHTLEPIAIICMLEGGFGHVDGIERVTELVPGHDGKFGPVEGRIQAHFGPYIEMSTFKVDHWYSPAGHFVAEVEEACVWVASPAD